MSSNTGPLNPTVQFIQRVLEEIVGRFFRGELQYQRDRKVLIKYAHLAQEMEQIALVARIYNTVGVIDMEYGYLQAAVPLFQQAYDTAAPLNFYYVTSRSQNNLGEILRYQGDLEGARQHYEKARQLAAEGQDLAAEVVVLSNLGTCATAQKDLEQAEAFLQAAYDIFKDDPWNHLRALISQRTALAEVYIQQGKYEAAWALTQEAEERCKGQDFKPLLPAIHLARAHLMEAQPGRQAEAKSHFEAARLALEALNIPRIFALTLLEEARYQARHGKIEDCHRLAREAQAHFQGLEMNEYAQIAAALLPTSA